MFKTIVIIYTDLKYIITITENVQNNRFFGLSVLLAMN